MMNLQRFLAGALIVYLLGIAALYAGINRAPFRQHGPGHQSQHQSSWLNSTAADDTDGKATIRLLCRPDSV